MGKVVVVGSSNTDLVTLGRNLPKPGETLIHDRFVRAAGGKGANQAVAAARAGAEVTLIAALGADSFGREAMAGFRRDHIRTRFIKQRKGVASGIALILVDDRGENMITVAPGANSTLKPADIRSAATAIRDCDVVLVCLEIPLPAVREALSLARRHHRTTILNPAPAPEGGIPSSLLRMADILTPNEHEVTVLGANLIRRWLSLTSPSPALLTTLGKRGVMAVKGGSRRHFPAFRVKAVDSVGAGDAFNGALAAALSSGQSLEEAIRFAQASAALSVTRLGAQPGMPRRLEILDLLGKNAGRN